jgi:phytoene dehydrogenase-like protein
MEQEREAIIIGSGIAGLAAGVLLSRAGLKPLILEHHFAAGGNAQTFRRKRMFDFDVGLHYLGDCAPGGLFPTLMRNLGLEGEAEFLPMDKDGFDTLIYPDLRFRVPAGWENYRRRLHEAFPQERHAIDRYLEFAQATARGAWQPPSGEPTALERRLGKPASACTLGEVFDGLECSLRLRHILASFSGTYAVPPSRASAAINAGLQDHYLRSGGYFIKGGGRALVAALVGAVRDNGGELRLRSRVRRILVEGGAARGVELANGEVLRSRIVISNADAKRTLLEMVGPRHLSEATVERAEETRMALPLFVIYLAMKRDPRELGIPNTNYSLASAYNIEQMYASCYDGELPDEPAVFLSIASRKDPESANIAPVGYTNLQLMTVAPAALRTWGVDSSPSRGGRYRHTLDYTTTKKEMEERMLRQVERMMPGFLRDVVWQESATPLSQERFTLSTGGTSYGLEASPDQMGTDRFPIKTEVEGLYLVGAGTIFGHGIAGTMVSGQAAAGAILSGR